MNKKEFINILSQNTKLNKDICKKVFNETINIIKTSFYTGRVININNFGKFTYKEMMPRKRYLPSLNCYRMEKHKVVPKFMPSKTFYGKMI